MNPTDDALEELLHGRGLPRASDELREATLEQTLALLRQRRRRRRWQTTGGLVAASLILALAGVALFRGSRQETVVQETRPTPIPEQMRNPTPPPVLAADTPARVLERLGETSRPEVRAELYRRAGDRYLEETADASSALRCYTQSLDEGSDDDLTVSAGDSWLMMAIKLDRKKEKRNANHD